MIQIRWVVTDDISNITLDEFDNAYVYMGICGHFDITVNEHREGMYLKNETEMLDCDGFEDILYWIDNLFCALNTTKNGEDYEMPMLNLVRIKFKFHLEQKLQISCMDVESNDIEWMEEVEVQEFEEEIQNHRKRLIEYIKKENPELLKSRWLEKLLDV